MCHLCAAALIIIGLWLAPSTAHADIAPNWVGENVLDPGFHLGLLFGKFGLGTCTEDGTATEDFGTIISQAPPAGTDVPCTLDCPDIDVVISAKPPIPNVGVPDLVGVTVTSIEDIADLSAFDCTGLTLGTITEDENAAAPFGTIMSQDPAAGSSVPWGTIVDVVVSTNAVVFVPDLIGWPLDTAQSTTLPNNNLTLGTVTEDDTSCYGSGTIFDQIPTAGSLVSAGSAVDVWVSTNSNPIPLPNYVGSFFSEAIASIEILGFNLGSVTVIPDEATLAGRVVSQNPAAGTCGSEPSAQIDLEISSGDAPGGSILFYDDFSTGNGDKWLN